MRTGYKRVFSAILISTLLFGCSNEDNQHNSNFSPEPESVANIINVAEIDMENDYLQCRLAENVEVNGTVTPYSKYKSGVNAYYINKELYVNQQDFTNEQLNQMFSDKLNEIMDAIEQSSKGTFLREQAYVFFEDPSYAFADVTYKDSDDTEKQLMTKLYVSSSGEVKISQISFCRMEGYGEATFDEQSVAEDIIKHNPDYSVDEFYFAGIDQGKKAFLNIGEGIINASYYDNYVCVPVDYENYSIVPERVLGEYVKYPLKDEYYQYYFRNEIDGFPVDNLNGVVIVKKVEEMDPVEGYTDSFLTEPTNRNYELSFMQYDADGIRSLSINSEPIIGDVYKDKEPIVDLKYILEDAQLYFKNNMSSKWITISNVELCYVGHFSDSKDGLLRHVVRPFWKVDYIVDDDITKTCTVQSLHYDAYSGECVEFDNLD